MHFHSVQTRLAKDENGEPIDSEDTGAREFTDIWTFERDLTLSDPNWKLTETDPPTMMSIEAYMPKKSITSRQRIWLCGSGLLRR